jgi:hypothetical protein
MFEKRGLSAVVTTLIIILLVLVAIGIVWVVIRGVVQEGAEGIDLGAFTLDLEIKKVQITEDNVTVTVLVKRNPGRGEFIGMNFVFSDGENSEVIRQDTVLAELEERSFTFNLTEISTSDLETVSVTPIYETSSGRESMGGVADIFDAQEGKSLVTGDVVAPPGEGNFAKYGPVGAGYTEYKVSSGDELPKFKRIIIDPLDVHVGENQTFTVIVYSPHGITEVTSRTQLDNEILVLPLEKTGEDLDGSEVYSATWTVYDTHSTVYRTNFTARDNAGNENTATMSWTDPCVDITDHGSNFFLSTGCSLSGTTVEGIDEGNITLQSLGSITLTGGTFAWTPGYSIFLSGGNIYLSGGSLKRGYLHLYDDDGDNYAPNGTYIFSASSDLGSGHERAKNVVNTTDCDDTNISEWRNINGYTDSDNDGFSPSGAIPVCVGSGGLPPGYISTGGSGSTTTGPNNPSSAGSIWAGTGSVIWGTPTNIYASGNSYATTTLSAGGKSYYLYGQGFGFNIPLDSKINGIKVEIEKKYTGSGTINDGTVCVRLWSSGTSYSNSKCVGDWPTSDSYVTYGSLTDTWGKTWDPETINSATFRVLQASNNTGGSAATAYVDHIRVTVNYTTDYLRSATLDCYDSNSDARPEKSIDPYYGTDRGDTSYDYNCDSAETKFYPTADGANVCDVGGTDECNDIGYLFSVPACGASGTFIIPTCNGNRCFSQSIQQTCK